MTCQHARRQAVRMHGAHIGRAVMKAYFTIPSRLSVRDESQALLHSRCIICYTRGCVSHVVLAVLICKSRVHSNVFLW